MKYDIIEMKYYEINYDDFYVSISILDFYLFVVWFVFVVYYIGIVIYVVFL